MADLQRTESFAHKSSGSSFNSLHFSLSTIKCPMTTLDRNMSNCVKQLAFYVEILQAGRGGGEEGRIGQTGMDIFSPTLLVIGQLKQKRTRLR